MTVSMSVCGRNVWNLSRYVEIEHRQTWIGAYAVICCNLAFEMMQLNLKRCNCIERERARVMNIIIVRSEREEKRRRSCKSGKVERCISKVLQHIFSENGIPFNQNVQCGQRACEPFSQFYVAFSISCIPMHFGWVFGIRQMSIIN